MHQTSRIRVLSDRIPRALVFVYYCRGLSENMKRRPTCHVYNEIITCRAIFLNLEEFRSHGNEWEARRVKALVWFWIITRTLVLTSLLSVCRLNEVGTCQVMEQVMIMVMMVMTTR